MGCRGLRRRLIRSFFLLLVKWLCLSRGLSRGRRARSRAATAWAVGIILLGFRLEGVERLGPELIEPGAQRAEPFRVDLVDVARALVPVDHEAGFLQHLEVL